MMSIRPLPIEAVIPERNIIVISPHYDDFLFFLGGYVLELAEQGLLHTKSFRIVNVFSRSNYLAHTGSGNFDSSLDRQKLATGKRLLEDLGCIDELLGSYNYGYELLGENECFTRGKQLADSEMEFPHGMYADFTEQDHEIFARMITRTKEWATLSDTALVFPVAFKEHIDHFIVREAAVAVAKELGGEARSTIYFQEDKPYGGIATEEEMARIEAWVGSHPLERRIYRHHPEAVVQLAFKHYVSQVDDVYRVGVMNRANALRSQYGTEFPCDQLYRYRCGN
ncbi:hypothetical protein [Paenibacillus sp. OV219]|uniref:hypothetical protein n=1 Tax=Paenibacillus sp. OV219 TaxID=1884377 RepID=UPI0008C1418B|nr:hypothetical protein [Paenibacillus sp. OV219]SEN87797.1 hypothetical protein SAMN05518847_104371 [Paenibacillus sp. OV219]